MSGCLPLCPDRQITTGSLWEGLSKSICGSVFNKQGVAVSLAKPLLLPFFWFEAGILGQVTSSSLSEKMALYVAGGG